MIVVAK